MPTDMTIHAIVIVAIMINAFIFAYILTASTGTHTPNGTLGVPSANGSPQQVRDHASLAIDLLTIDTVSAWIPATPRACPRLPPDSGIRPAELSPRPGSTNSTLSRPATAPVRARMPAWQPASAPSSRRHGYLLAFVAIALSTPSSCPRGLLRQGPFGLLYLLIILLVASVAGTALTWPRCPCSPSSPGTSLPATVTRSTCMTPPTGSRSSPSWSAALLVGLHNQTYARASSAALAREQDPPMLNHLSATVVSRTSTTHMRRTASGGHQHAQHGRRCSC